jgi:drug/metabolite transporter (DMT)-like permease
VVLGEPLNWRVVAGGGLVTAGALVLAWPKA